MRRRMSAVLVLGLLLGYGLSATERHVQGQDTGTADFATVIERLDSLGSRLDSIESSQIEMGLQLVDIKHNVDCVDDALGIYVSFGTCATLGPTTVDSIASDVSDIQSHYQFEVNQVRRSDINGLAKTLSSIRNLVENICSKVKAFCFVP